MPPIRKLSSLIPLERYGVLTVGLGSLAVLVLLPPSETKAPEGDGPPLALDGLSYPELTPVRRKLIDELVTLAGDAPAGLTALGCPSGSPASWNATPPCGPHRRCPRCFATPVCSMQRWMRVRCSPQCRERQLAQHGGDHRQGCVGGDLLLVAGHHVADGD
jgi:hypothetical protein